MIHTGTGNILQAQTEALVNTVNCVGVMGKGVALQFKRAWPEMYEDYRRAAKAGEVEPGRMHVWSTGLMIGGPKLIINFPTKRHWRQGSRMEDVEAGLVDLVRVIREHGLRSVAIPPLGAGLGGLPWAEVKRRIVEALAPLEDVEVLLWDPGHGPQADQHIIRTQRPEMSPAKATVLALMDRYRIMDHEITHLEVQKLAYFMEEAGAGLELQFKAERYGPYSDRLYQMLMPLEGHFIRGLADRSPMAPLRVLPEALAEARALLERDAGTRALFERVAELVSGFETPYGLELLATLHWLAHREPEAAEDVELAIERVQAWNAGKAYRLKPEHLRIAWEQLHAEGWMPEPARRVAVG
ncbi:MAG: macro domain-containing protein [Alphaproteobacteria bacterium]|nr:macro domain-containing protein [Alphaproteobacteria bacterium]